MKIFIINLKKDVEKREKVEAQLEALNLDYEIIEAIYGKDLSDEELELLVKDYKNCYLTKGEVGCTLSHQKIYKKMQEENIHHALILEDDVIVKPEVKEFLEEMDEFLAEKNNFIALLYKGKEYIINKKIKLKNGIELFEVGDNIGTYAYIITKNSAKTMLKINSPIIFEADFWEDFQILSFLKIYNTNTNFIVTYDNENKEFSNIEAERALVRVKRKEYYAKVIKKNFKYKLFKKYYKIFRRPFRHYIKDFN